MAKFISGVQITFIVLEIKITMTLDTEIINKIDHWISDVGPGKEAVIPLLHRVQKEFQYLPETVLREICQKTEITPADIMGVSTFYDQFRHEPIGEHLIQVCTGTACHVKGSELVYDAFFRELKIPSGTDTDPDKKFTVQKVACLGCCTLAPVVQIDSLTFGHVKPDSVHQVIQNFLLHKDEAITAVAKQKPETAQGEIRIGLGSCCIASGSGKVQQALESTLATIETRPHVKRVGCVGMCHRTPLLEIELPDQGPILYDHEQPDDVSHINWSAKMPLLSLFIIISNPRAH